MSESISFVRYQAPDDDASFVAFVDELLDAPGSRWVLHLEPRAFLGSAAFGALIRWQKRLDEADGRLVLVQPRRGVSRVMRMLGLEQVIAVFETEEEAVAFLDAAVEDERRVDAA